MEALKGPHSAEEVGGLEGLGVSVILGLLVEGATHMRFLGALGDPGAPALS